MTSSATSRLFSCDTALVQELSAPPTFVHPFLPVAVCLAGVSASDARAVAPTRGSDQPRRLRSRGSSSGGGTVRGIQQEARSLRWISMLMQRAQRWRVSKKGQAILGVSVLEWVVAATTGQEDRRTGRFMLYVGSIKRHPSRRKNVG